MQADYEYLQAKKESDLNNFTSVMNQNFKGALQASRARVQELFFMLYPDWRFFDAMMGAYYAFYNDGDDLQGAFDNARIPYESLAKMKSDRFAPSKNAMLYYFENTNDKNALETAMRSTVFHVMNSAQIKEMREMREALQVSACLTCGEEDPGFQMRNDMTKRFCGKECFKIYRVSH